MKSQWFLFVTAIVAACAQLNCSFLFLDKPPEPGEIPFRRMDGSLCTERNGKPVTDLVLTGAIPLSVLALMLGPGQGTGVEDTSSSERRMKIMLASALVVSAVTLTSAIWGFHTTRKCREYESRLAPAKPPSEEAAAGSYGE